MFTQVIGAAALAALAVASPVQKRNYVGPVFDQNFPDPSIIQDGSTWYAFATNSLGVHIPMAQSEPNNFNYWNVMYDDNGNVYDALPNGAGAWSTGANIWAPNVIEVNGQYIMYYTAQSREYNSKGNLAQCVGVATSDNVAGPYTALDEVLACPAGPGGAIDPSGFIDDDGSIYVVYKVDGNSIGNGGECNNGVAPYASTPIMLQAMDSTGTVTDGSDPIEILNRSDADGPLVEAPSLGRVDNTYFLFFSSGCYSDNSYDISYAYAYGDITNGGQNYAKQQYPYAPLAQTGTNNLYAPGGLAFAADGQHVAFMADSSSQTQSQTRQLYVGEVTVDAANGRISWS